MSDELKEAIEIIKAECAKYELCTDCPLYKVGYGCIVEASPYTWEVDNGKE